MTVRQSEWRPKIGILARRRPDGLSKTMAVSVVLHFLFFSLVILSQVLSKLNKPDYQSFQVNLVPSGVGVASPEKVVQKRVAKASKNKPSQTSKTPKTDKPLNSSKKAPPGLQVKAKIAPTNAPPLVQPKASKEKTPIKAPTAVQDDPDRLEEWWKKQSQTMKVTEKKPSEKQNKVVSPKRRTAKIDIIRKSIVVPPVVLNSKLNTKKNNPNTINPASPSLPRGHKADVESPETKALPPETSPSVTERMGDELPGPEAPDETASLGSRGGDGGIGSSGGASTGNVNFAFPGYLQRIDTKIRWQWAPPPIRPQKDSLVVRFDINKNGSIDKMSVVVKESSGNTFFDQAALRAVYAAHPFPALPDAYADQILTVYMHFIVQEAS